MVKFPEAHSRLFQGVFICKRCKSRRRTDMQKILLGKISCKRCGSHAFRPARKK